MKRNSLRRLGALVLSLALTLSLAPPAWAAAGDLTISGPSPAEVEKGQSIELTATWANGEPQGVTYTWNIIDTVQGVTLTGKDTDTVTVYVDGTATAGKVKVGLAAEWMEGTTAKNATDTFDVTVKADPGPTTPPTTDPPP